MKKAASILIIGFTSLLMLVVSVIPHHHHHNGNIHFINGKEHSHDCDLPFSDHQQEYPENSNCFVHSVFTVCLSDPYSKIKINSPELPDHFQFLSVLPNLLSLKDLFLTSQKKNTYGKYIRHFKLPGIKKSNGLRAPPVFCF